MYYVIMMIVLYVYEKFYNISIILWGDSVSKFGD